MTHTNEENKKIYAGDILDHILFRKEKLKDKDILKAVWKLDHPLKNIEHGYRDFNNTKMWNCTFCEKIIQKRERYWGYKKIDGSEGEKMCHICFLKFLTLIDHNDLLLVVLDKVWERDKEEREKGWEELQKYIPNLF